MQNLGAYKFKRSHMEKRIQTTLLINLLCLVVFVFVASLWNGLITEKLFDDHKYITDGKGLTATEQSLTSVVSFYLLFNNIIPLDLAVMVEFNAIFYSGFIVADSNMTYLNKDMGKIDCAKSNSLNLMENMAEVEYIMSDKTGTLTQNELTFVAACCTENSTYL